MAALETGRHGRAKFGRVVRSRGFTLLELVIVVAIIAILAAVAYPSYINYIVKTKRSAAAACLSQYANFMERYYTTNLRYDQDASATPLVVADVDLDCSADSQTGEDYSYSGVVTRTDYTIQAQPQGAQQTRDTKCAVLAIDQTGKRYYNTNHSDDAGVAECWK